MITSSRKADRYDSVPMENFFALANPRGGGAVYLRRLKATIEPRSVPHQIC